MQTNIQANVAGSPAKSEILKGQSISYRGGAARFGVIGR